MVFVISAQQQFGVIAVRIQFSIASRKQQHHCLQTESEQLPTYLTQVQSRFVTPKECIERV